jgi:hypothetical protein
MKEIPNIKHEDDFVKYFSAEKLLNFQKIIINDLKEKTKKQPYVYDTNVEETRECNFSNSKISIYTSYSGKIIYENLVFSFHFNTSKNIDQISNQEYYLENIHILKEESLKLSLSQKLSNF